MCISICEKVALADIFFLKPSLKNPSLNCDAKESTALLCWDTDKTEREKCKLDFPK